MNGAGPTTGSGTYSSFNSSNAQQGLDTLQTTLGQSPDPYSQAANQIISLVRSFLGTTHYIANDFVQHLQNPFGFQLSQIIGLKDESLRIGSATVDSLNAAKRAVMVSWNAFQIAASVFSQAGYDYAFVANKGLNTLNAPNGMGTPGQFPNGFVTQLIEDIDKQIIQLGGTPDPVITYADPIHGTTTLTPPSHIGSYATVAVLILVAGLLFRFRGASL